MKAKIILLEFFIVNFKVIFKSVSITCFPTFLLQNWLISNCSEVAWSNLGLGTYFRKSEGWLLDTGGWTRWYGSTSNHVFGNVESFGSTEFTTRSSFVFVVSGVGSPFLMSHIMLRSILNTLLTGIPLQRPILRQIHIDQLLKTPTAPKPTILIRAQSMSFPKRTWEISISLNGFVKLLGIVIVMSNSWTTTSHIIHRMLTTDHNFIIQVTLLHRKRWNISSRTLWLFYIYRFYLLISIRT